MLKKYICSTLLIICLLTFSSSVTASTDAMRSPDLQLTFFSSIDAKTATPCEYYSSPDMPTENDLPDLPIPKKSLPKNILPDTDSSNNLSGALSGFFSSISAIFNYIGILFEMAFSVLSLYKIVSHSGQSVALSFSGIFLNLLLLASILYILQKNNSEKSNSNPVRKIFRGADKFFPRSIKSHGNPATSSHAAYIVDSSTTNEKQKKFDIIVKNSSEFPDNAEQREVKE